jgi:hypothetical protein
MITRKIPFMRSVDRLLFVVAVLALPLAAQWVNYPTAGVPRTPDGKPNLFAPAPKTADGKPDFSGLWQPGPTPAPYFLDVIQDPKDESIFLPAAEAVFKRHLSDFRRDVVPHHLDRPRLPIRPRP